VSETDLSSKEVKDAIAAAVAEEVQGLKTKNSELLEQNKRLKKGQEIDPAELERVESERDQYKQQLAEATKAVKKAATDTEAATKRAEAAEGSTSKLLVENGLNDALAKANVTNPALVKAAKAMLAGQVELVDDNNGAKVPKVGGKALAEHITEWAGSDEGKNFVTAPDTNGSGAQGARGSNHNQSQGDLGGSKQERTAAIAARFPDIPK